MRVVWLNGEIVDPSRAVLPIDDPGVRWGEGLFETMRAERGGVAQLERHLERLTRSAATIGLHPMPTPDEVRAGVAGALEAGPDGPRRVRLTATPGPTLLIEVTPESDLAPEVPAVSALALRGAWSRDARIAEHKCVSYAAHRWSQRDAQRSGADHALLLDHDGRLGEAALASVFCAIGSTVITAPVAGLLPGIARSIVRDRMAVREEALDETVWWSADEIILTNAVAGALAVVSVNGSVVGDGAVGPVARSIGDLLRTELRGS